MLHEEAIRFIDTHGYPIILGRVIDNRKCPCITEKGEPNFDCKKCNGTGRIFSKKIVKVCNQFTYDEQQRSFWGELTESQRIFFMDSTSTPTINDIIILVKLNNEGKIIRPIVVEEKYNIVAVKPYRGPNGILVYYWIKGDAGNA